MAKTPSMFVPLDVNYMRDPRIRRAGSDAELLFTTTTLDDFIARIRKAGRPPKNPP
jgi:hypothetical protein